MSRRREAEKRKLIPDSKFNSELVTKLINHIMIEGKKSRAEFIVYKALDLLKQKSKNIAQVNVEKEKIQLSRKPLEENEAESRKISYEHKEVELLDLALENVRPSVEVRPRRVGGATYQVPMEVRVNRRDALAIRWIIEAARKRNEHGMENRLANELLAALSGSGSGALKKCEEVKKMVAANLAFAHFRWN